MFSLDFKTVYIVVSVNINTKDKTKLITSIDLRSLFIFLPKTKLLIHLSKIIK